MADFLDVTLRCYQNYEHDRVPWNRLRDIARVTQKPWDWIVHGGEPVDLGGELRQLHQEMSRVSEQLERLLSRDSAGKVQRAVADPGRAGRGTRQGSSRKSRAKGKRQAGG